MRKQLQDLRAGIEAARAMLRADISPSGLQHVARSTTTGAIISTFNAFIFVVGARAVAEPADLAAWFLAAVLPAFYIRSRSHIALKKALPSRVSDKARQRALILAAVYAAPWAVLPLMFLGSGDGVDTLVVTICAGMCAGGAFMLHRAPTAAAVFFGSILVCFVAACLIYNAALYWPLAMLAAPYNVFLLFMTRAANATALSGEKSLQQAEEALADLREANRELDRLRSAAESDAAIDELTGLANRRGLTREVERRQLSSSDHGVAVFHLDLDRFKQINDTLGHAAGDHVLRNVALRLRQETAAGDFVARVGGDEFAIIARFDGDRGPIEELARRIIAALKRPVMYGEEVCNFGVSIGVDVLARGASEIDFGRLLTNADIALYRAKEDGRGRFQFFDNSLRDAVEMQKNRSDGLIAALQQHQVYPVYQPQFTADGLALCGVEALARWRDTMGTEMDAGAIVDIAQRLGVSRQIDALILSRALDDRDRWKSLGLRAPTISLNISADRLSDPMLVETLEERGVAQGELALELSATAFGGRISDLQRHALDAFADLGVDLVLDDFGVGDSSLATLLAIRPKRLKVSSAFAARSPLHQELVRSVVGLARDRHVVTVAKDIETEAMAALMRDLGFHQLQGRFFSVPLAADEMSERFFRPGSLEASAL